MGGGPRKEKRTPFSELPEEKKEEIRARQEERKEKEGREIVSDDLFEGKLVKRGKGNGWIKVFQMSKIPQDVKKKIREMTKTQKKRAIEKGRQDAFVPDAIYLRMSDCEEGV